MVNKYRKVTVREYTAWLSLLGGTCFIEFTMDNENLKSKLTLVLLKLILGVSTISL